MFSSLHKRGSHVSKVKEEDQVLVSLLGYQTKPAAAFAGYTGASLLVCGSEGGNLGPCAARQALRLRATAIAAAAAAAPTPSCYAYSWAREKEFPTNST